MVIKSVHYYTYVRVSGDSYGPLVLFMSWIIFFQQKPSSLQVTSHILSVLLQITLQHLSRIWRDKSNLLMAKGNSLDYALPKFFDGNHGRFDRRKEIGYRSPSESYQDSDFFLTVFHDRFFRSSDVFITPLCRNQKIF